MTVYLTIIYHHPQRTLEIYKVSATASVQVYICSIAPHRLYKTVFPTGLDDYTTPAHSPVPSRKPSTPSLHSTSSGATTPTLTAPPTKSSIFGRWGASSLTVSKPPSPAGSIDPAVDGPIEDFIVAGTAFGEQTVRYCYHVVSSRIRIWTLQPCILPSARQNQVCHQTLFDLSTAD